MRPTTAARARHQRPRREATFFLPLSADRGLSELIPSRKRTYPARLLSSGTAPVQLQSETRAPSPRVQTSDSPPTQARTSPSPLSRVPLSAHVQRPPPPQRSAHRP